MCLEHYHLSYISPPTVDYSALSPALFFIVSPSHSYLTPLPGSLCLYNTVPILDSSTERIQFEVLINS